MASSVLIQPNGETTEFAPKNGVDFDLDQLQEAVGGFIELIYLPDDKLMVINEEGKLDGLEFNAAATQIASPVLGGIDVIVGPALVCDQSMVS